MESNQLTLGELSLHNTNDDCWVVYDGKVYDLSSYLPMHDRYLNIRDWCGKDMTEDFQTKAELKEDHKESSYRLLENYYIGDLVSSQEQIVSKPIADTEVVSTTPYNLIIPLFLSLALYWVPYFFIKNKRKFNAFWNTVLLLTLLIPSFGFGIFMMLRYKRPALYDIDFNFMYWHVELSIVMGVVAISHFIQRFKIYLVQLKK